MPLIDHPIGDYRFLPGIAPYSCGVVSKSGFEIVQVTLARPVPYLHGFERITEFLAAQGRERAALCGVSLRSPKPYSFAGFGEFNGSYAIVLRDWGLFVDGVNPVARTNVAPAVAAPAEPVLYGFSFTRPCPADQPATFVVAGAGELPEGKLARADIIAVGDTSPAAIDAKARFVMDLMEIRLRGLGMDWPTVSMLNIYTVHSITTVLPEIVLKRIGSAAIHGAHSYYSRPPVEEIEYEMDLRGVRTELRI